MRNPFRSEADAFRFVWLTIGYFALIFIGSLINLWVGIAVFVVVTAVAFRWFFRRGVPEAPVKQTPAASPPGDQDPVFAGRARGERDRRRCRAPRGCARARR